MSRAPARIGNNQLHLLGILARPGTVLISATPTSRSLTRRGLLTEARHDSFVHIAPAGLRALADAAEAGLVELAPAIPEAPDAE